MCTCDPAKPSSPLFCREHSLAFAQYIAAAEAGGVIDDFFTLYAIPKAVTDADIATSDDQERDISHKG